MPLLLLTIPGLREKDVARMPQLREITAAGQIVNLVPSFPCVTCPVQANMTTGRLPSAHGVVGNGLYWRQKQQIEMWTSPNDCIERPQIWDILSHADLTSAVWFAMHSFGAEADYVCTPKPIHKHHGGMLQDCYSQPHDLYARLSAELGRPFNLMHYWGPLASHRATDWIVDATCAVMTAPDLAPDLLLTYLPHLDYDLQRYGPGHKKVFQALEKTYVWLSKLWKTAEASGYDIVIFGDYAIEEVSGAPVFPNCALRDAGLFQVRSVAGRAYPDFFTSAAFAMVDHQIAHVYALAPERRVEVRRALEQLDGIAEIHERGGDFLIAAQPGRWFAYPWWSDKREAPDYAGHVDIHNKPGYDPCELFWGWPPGAISQDAARIRGTHGLADPGRAVAWASSLPSLQPATLLDLAQQLKQHLARA